MEGKNWLGFIVFIIIVFLGLVIYDNQESIHWSVLKQEGLVPANSTAPSIIPHIPYQFVNILVLVFGVLIIVGIFVGIYRSLR